MSPAEVDEALAVRAAAGDAGAFEALVRRWKRRVFRLARRVVDRPEDAEDVTQEVFLKMHRSLETYRSDAPFEHWLLRIASNACVDALRERRRKPAAPLADLTDRPGEWLDRALRGASLRAAEAEGARRLARELLDALPPRDRMVLVLMDLEGLTAAQTAAAVGSTRGAVKVRAMRARRALRRLARRVPERSG